ncbi:energy transducer TonB [Hoylesella oralis]|uniref:energy transducer TonB n=1 Tax=Hoylesella oralis TaxID=28134 RepID=UPI0028EA667D|nr:energy transducer TonB [Hoylesella oralis]
MLIFVTEDGLLSNAKIVRSVTPAFDKEALRIVRSMSRWMPGTQNGKVVRVKYNISINFRAY